MNATVEIPSLRKCSTILDWRIELGVDSFAFSTSGENWDSNNPTLFQTLPNITLNWA